MKYYFRKNRNSQRPKKQSFSLILLRVFGNAVGWIYRMAFGGFDEALCRRQRQGFIAKVNRSFAYLFSEHGGSVHPHDGEDLPRAFDYVCVTLEFTEMRVRLTSGRGELDAEVAPAREPGDWRDLGFLWRVTASSEGVETPWVSSSLDGLAEQLTTTWGQLTSVLTEENWFPSLTLAEWRRFLTQPKEERLAILASYKAKGPLRARYFSFTTPKQESNHAE